MTDGHAGVRLGIVGLALIMAGEAQADAGPQPEKIPEHPDAFEEERVGGWRTTAGVGVEAKVDGARCRRRAVTAFR